jgi:hypothetical protein
MRPWESLPGEGNGRGKPGGYGSWWGRRSLAAGQGGQTWSATSTTRASLRH